jgi:hypothetical protein
MLGIASFSFTTNPLMLPDRSQYVLLKRFVSALNPALDRDKSLGDFAADAVKRGIKRLGSFIPFLSF